jgi:hypothetical protein
MDEQQRYANGMEVREVETVNGALYNVEFDTFKDMKELGK